MASTAERNKNRTRPTKSNGLRIKRQNQQKKRLVALGMDQAAADLLNPKEVRTLLKHPAKVAKEHGGK